MPNVESAMAKWQGEIEISLNGVVSQMEQRPTKENAPPKSDLNGLLQLPADKSRFLQLEQAIEELSKVQEDRGEFKNENVQSLKDQMMKYKDEWSAQRIITSEQEKK